MLKFIDKMRRKGETSAILNLNRNSLELTQDENQSMDDFFVALKDFGISDVSKIKNASEMVCD